MFVLSFSQCFVTALANLNTDKFVWRDFEESPGSFRKINSPAVTCK